MTVTADGPDGNPISPVESVVIIPVQVNASYSLSKQVTPQVFSKAGQIVEYVVTMTNTGNVTLVRPTVSDPLCSLVTAGDGPLGPNQSRAFTCSYPVTQQDVDTGALVNTARASAVPATCGEGPVLASTDCRPLERDAAVTVAAEQSPTVQVQKGVTPQTVTVGGEMLFDVVVANDGNVTLYDVSVSDPMCDLQRTDGAPGEDRHLSPEERWGFDCSYMATTADAAQGRVNNVVTVSSETLKGSVVIADGSASAVVTLPDESGLPQTGTNAVSLAAAALFLFLGGLILIVHSQASVSERSGQY